MLFRSPRNPGEALVQSLQAVEGGAAGGRAMDLRDYGIGAQILRSLGLQQIRLLTRHPRRMVGLEAYGLELADPVELT